MGEMRAKGKQGSYFLSFFPLALIVATGALIFDFFVAHSVILPIMPRHYGGNESQRNCAS